MEVKANLSFESCSYLRNKLTMGENLQKLSKLLNVTFDLEEPKDLSVEDIKKGAKIFFFLILVQQVKRNLMT